MDAITYFFLNSAIAIGATAFLFSIFGIWFGYLLWGRFKRRYRGALEEIEILKTENAQLKRRFSEQGSRPAPVPRYAPYGPMITTPALAPVHPTESAAVPMPMPELEPLPVPPELPAILPSKAFSLWTESGWKPIRHRGKKLPPSHAFTLWTEKEKHGRQPRSVHTTPAIAALSTLPELPALPELLAPEPGNKPKKTSSRTMEVPGLPAISPAKVPVPPARGFSLWTEESWQPPPSKAFPLPPSAATSLWLADDFQPLALGPAQPSQAFSLWTDADWTPSPTTAQTYPPSAASTLWIADDFQPQGLPPAQPSQAHSLWTEPGWVPQRSLNPPYRSGRPFTLWTTAELSPRTWPAPPAQSFSVWTETAWTPQRTANPPLRSARSFTVWTTQNLIPNLPTKTLPSQAFTLWPQEQGSAKSPVITAKPPTVTETISKPINETALHAKPERKGSFIARLLTSARTALGIETHAPASSTSIDAKEVTPPVEGKAIPRRSQAFTVWTDPTAASAPPATTSQPSVRQSVTLATLTDPNPVEGSSTPTEPTKPAPATASAAIENFREELTAGLVLNDFLLGIVYKNPPEDRDDLTELRGITSAQQAQLNHYGVFTFRQIALWTDQQVENITHRLATPDRQMSADWVSQAKKFIEKS